VNDVRQPGLYETTWNGTDESGSRVSSGAYYVRLVTRDGTQSRPVVLLK
jgi:flagellar hook assembly protein FlgD